MNTDWSEDQLQLMAMENVDNCVDFFVRFTIRRCGLEREDVAQEMKIETLLASKTFSTKEKSATFFTYLWKRLSWRSKDLIKCWYRHMRLKEALSTVPVEPASMSISMEYFANQLKKKLKNKRAIKVVDLLKNPPQELKGPMDYAGGKRNNDCIEPERVAAYLGISTIHLRRSVLEIKRAIGEILQDE